MRRGHPGVGGWRNENHRHFRPRTGSAPRFRPPRAYSLCEIPRFPPPGPRLSRGPHIYNAHSNEHGIADNHDRQNYRPPNHYHNNPRQQDRHQQRPRDIYSYINVNYKKDGNTKTHSYKHSSTFYNDAQSELLHVNSHGDVDHRQHGAHDQDAFNPPRLNQWVDPPSNQRHLYEDRTQTYRPHDSERQHTEGNKTLPSFDYTGHRPPSSDYYGSTSGTTTNNNDTSFSRSVNDTVDIVRKRLMNRSDPLPTIQDASNSQNNNEQVLGRNVDQHTLQDLPTKKRMPRQRQNAKSNCDKMKSKIVNQLFKMGKDKMHKLMDDPGSSSKFEYAISSLITESQNSLNRHLRSIAEKSLVSTCSDDFIHNDNNTIYEDTFMKQMQCLLDPQDTILLEDIKPLVMAELSKVLQLDDFEPYTRYDTDDQGSHGTTEVPQNHPNYEILNYDELPQEVNYDIDLRNSSNYSDVTQTEVYDVTDPDFKYDNRSVSNKDNYQNSEPLFERRTSRHDHENRTLSVENHRQRKSIENAMDKIFSPEEPAPPLFNSNAEILSEDEDTFAELDRQYHVAVNPNFLDDMSARTTPSYSPQVEANPTSVKKEVNNELQSSESLFKSVKNNLQNNREIDVLSIKEEPLQSPDFPKENSTPINSDSISSKTDHVIIKHEHAAKSNDTCRESEKSKSSNISKTSASNSRKRSTDQRPSHRKEKRKKTESRSSDKHENSSSKDRHSKSNDLPKSSYYSIFRTKDDYDKHCSKDHRRNNNSKKGYSEKYVKRKQPQKSKDQQQYKNRKHSSSTQIILSPNDTNNTSITSAKSDSKTKLKPIDMFVEQTKKVSIHHAHRNTATNPATPTTPVAAPKIPAVEDIAKPVISSPQKIVETKHASTQVFKRVITKMTQTVDNITLHSRYCQTEIPSLINVGVQTSRVNKNKAVNETKDAFERMKQIDLEIQELLQEKFQLYSNLESNNMGPHEESYLSVTVLNVGDMEQQGQHIEITDNIDISPVENTIPELTVELDNKIENESSEDTTMAADAIVDDFTNIPVEELEQIALETVTEDVNFDDNKVAKRSARHKVLLEQRMASESPKSTSSRRSNKKAKTPNISLLEQIITDDRPLEDIISLDDLEEPHQRQRKKPSKPKKMTTKKSKSKKPIDISPYGLKECSVILIQTDLSKYFHESYKIPQVESYKIPQVEEIPTEIDNIVTLEPSKVSPFLDKEFSERQKRSLHREIVEETDVNDLQFDMLDVSEDIVIGESCEIKDKDSIIPTVTISEDLILDNSQSSADDAIVGESGPAENECKTYDYSTDEELRRDSLTVTGNADAVLAIECIESDFIAACLDGNVYHFSGDGQLLNTMRGSNLAVTCLTIVKEKYGTTVYTGSLDSRIRYYDLNTGLEKGPECNVLSPIQTMDLAWDTVFVGTRTGFVLQFECKNNMLIPVSTVKFSEQAILALRAMKEGPRKVLLVASRSENVTIKDAQTGLLLRTLLGPKMTVYTLLFEDGKVYCGTSSHQIHVFDYSSGTHTGCHEGGKGAVCLRATGGLLFAGCYDGCVYVYREGETRPLAQLRGPSLMLLSLAVVGSKIIAGYKDRSLYIWKIPLSILREMIL